VLPPSHAELFPVQESKIEKAVYDEQTRKGNVAAAQQKDYDEVAEGDSGEICSPQSSLSTLR